MERRLAAPPVLVSGPDGWNSLRASDAYTRVVAVGRYRAGADTRVRAVTALGGGDWILTPFDTGAFLLLVNRGFVPAGHRGAVPPPGGTIVVRGLLRLSEPGGGFLLRNDPAADRWVSRDVAAIARARGLTRVAPYFVDADANAGAPLPVGGLTVVRFADNHLLYAITWFALAATTVALSVQRARRQRR